MCTRCFLKVTRTKVCWWTIDECILVEMPLRDAVLINKYIQTFFCLLLLFNLNVLLKERLCGISTKTKMFSWKIFLVSIVKEIFVFLSKFHLHFYDMGSIRPINISNMINLFLTKINCRFAYEVSTIRHELVINKQLR